MALDKYTIQHKSISNILGLIDMGKIAIPEIQRPFVWKTTKVRDLMDSLYRGFPVGYIITWQNPDVRLKDGTSSKGKTILIDGQQRVTAIKAAIDGQKVINENYESVRIRIAFNPAKEQLETCTPAIEKDKEWIPDIAVVMKPDFDIFGFIENYTQNNSGVDKTTLSKKIQNLVEIKTRTIGELEINDDVEIETVDEIFVRINSKGTRLSEADFAMSKIAVFEIEPGDEYGMILRKFFDYFCHLLQAPKAIEKIREHDTTFRDSEQFAKIQWVASAQDLIFKPSYSDVIRLAGMIGLNRAKARDVVALLSGRNFEVKSFNKEDSYLKTIADDSFVKFNGAIEIIVNEYNYKRFEQDILRGSGFTDTAMFNSSNLLNYTFAVFQKLLKLTDDYALVRSLARKFMVYSILTEHHSGSFETRWEADFKSFDGIENVKKLVADFEAEQLNDIYWTITLSRELDKIANSKTPKWNLFVAAQNKLGKHSFLSDVETRNMKISDLHHIFPQEYMKANGKNQNDYNRIGNFVILSRDINIKIGKTAPAEYLKNIEKYGSGIADLEKNLEENCIPSNPELWRAEKYEEFLVERNKKIAKLIKEYYEGL